MRKVFLLGLALAIPAMVLSLGGVVYVVTTPGLRWLLPLLLLWQAGAVVLLLKWKPWSPPSLADEPPGQATQTELDRQALDLVEGFKQHVLQGDYTLDQQTVFRLSQDLLERIARHYHPQAQDPLLKVRVTLLLRALEEAAGDMARLSLKIPLVRHLTLEDLHRGRRAWLWGRMGYQFVRLLAPFISPRGTFLGKTLHRLFLAPISSSVPASLEKAVLVLFLDRLGYHLIRLYGASLALDQERPFKPEQDRHRAWAHPSDKGGGWLRALHRHIFKR